MPEYVSAKQAAELAGLSARTVRRWIIDGRLPAVKFGRSFRIALADLAQLMGQSFGTRSDAPMNEPSALPSLGITPAPATGTEMTTLVHDLMAELLQATAAAARWRTLAEVLIVQLEQAEQRRADPEPDRTRLGRPGQHVDRPPSVAWRDLLRTIADTTTDPSN
jgi:excisionase family DNA binding protein